MTFVLFLLFKYRVLAQHCEMSAKQQQQRLERLYQQL